MIGERGLCILEYIILVRMIAKQQEKKSAVALRKQGKTYSEILAQIPVAKSTLSLWLREIGLSKKQKQRLTQKKLEASLRGGEARRRQRIEATKVILDRAEKEIGAISKRELWLIGTALYWAEGSKEKNYNAGTARLIFMNSDPFMVAVYLRWLHEILHVQDKDIHLSLYIHENHRYRLPEIVAHWLNQTGVSKDRLSCIYFKKHNFKTRRKNIGKLYYGGLRVSVRRSAEINRKVAGWIKGVHNNLLR